MNRGILERINETTYFISTHGNELGEMNMRMTRRVLYYACFIYVCLLSFFYMLVGFTNIRILSLIMPASLVFYFGLNAWFKNRRHISLPQARRYSILFYLGLFTAISLTDASSRPADTASLFPLFLVAFSAFYVDYIYVVIGMEAAFVVDYLVIASFWKNADMVHGDILLCIAALLVSLFCYWIVLGMQTDRVTDNRILEAKSSTDLLTGLYNKLSFEEKANSFLEERQAGEGCALIIIDFDNFKHVNDEYGHLVGDQVLARCGKILSDSFRVQDIVGRVGGDEFMVMITDLDANSKIEKRCDEVQHQLNVMKVGEAGQFSASIGIIEDNLGKDFKELYLLADDALYEAKARGKKQYVKWQSKKIVPPTKMAVYIATRDKERADKIKRTLGDKYEFLEADSATVALNEISLYQNYLESIFFDYTLPDISEEVLQKYIHSRPLFAQIPVHDVQKEIDMKKDIF